jgi:hypothetical protein
MTPASVKVQIVPESLPSTPSWLGEVAIVAHVFTRFELLKAIAERVRFARARLGVYDTIDFVIVLLGYALSGEQTLEEFYERLAPFGKAFMALGCRERICLLTRHSVVFSPLADRASCGGTTNPISGGSGGTTAIGLVTWRTL